MPSRYLQMLGFRQSYGLQRGFFCHHEQWDGTPHYVLRTKLLLASPASSDFGCFVEIGGKNHQSCGMRPV